MGSIRKFDLKTFSELNQIFYKSHFSILMHCAKSYSFLGLSNQISRRGKQLDFLPDHYFYTFSFCTRNIGSKSLRQKHVWKSIISSKCWIDNVFWQFGRGIKKKSCHNDSEIFTEEWRWFRSVRRRAEIIAFMIKKKLVIFLMLYFLVSS